MAAKGRPGGVVAAPARGELSFQRQNNSPVSRTDNSPAQAIGTWTAGSGLPPAFLLIGRDHQGDAWTAEFLDPLTAAMRIVEGRA